MIIGQAINKTGSGSHSSRLIRVNPVLKHCPSGHIISSGRSPLRPTHSQLQARHCTVTVLMSAWKAVQAQHCHVALWTQPCVYVASQSKQVRVIKDHAPRKLNDAIAIKQVRAITPCHTQTADSQTGVRHQSKL